MEIVVKTEDADGNVTFEGVLKKNEVEFCLNVGINFLLAQGAFPFIKDDEADEAPSTDTLQ
jgi:hypothetical protein